MHRFIEWDSLEVRVDGAKIASMAREMVVKDPAIQKLDLTFSNGLLRIEGVVRKLILIPFTVDITHIDPKGTAVRVPLGRMTAGSIPIPSLLVALLRKQFPADIGFEPPATLVLSLDRFLPSFISAEIQKIWIIDGGLAVTLGRGGADLPDASSSESPRARGDGTEELRGTESKEKQ